MNGRPLVEFLPDEVFAMTPTDLKNWRTTQGLHQEALAALLGVHEITVSRWERGQVPIPPFLHYALWAIEHNAPKG